MHPFEAVSESRRREILAHLAELSEAPVGGYGIVETADMAAACEVAKGCPRWPSAEAPSKSAKPSTSTCEQRA